MRLDIFLVADAVSVPPDGKFYIQGGGLTRVIVPSLPFVLPQLGVLARLELEEEEVQLPHEYELQLNDSAGIAIGMLPKFVAPAPSLVPQLAEGEPRFTVLALNVPGIQVVTPGRHELVLRIDSEVMGTIPLMVVLLTPEQLATMTLPVQLPGDAPPATQRKPTARKSTTSRPPARRRRS